MLSLVILKQFAWNSKQRGKNKPEYIFAELGWSAVRQGSRVIFFCEYIVLIVDILVCAPHGGSITIGPPPTGSLYSLFPRYSPAHTLLGRIPPLAFAQRAVNQKTINRPIVSNRHTVELPPPNSLGVNGHQSVFKAQLCYVPPPRRWYKPTMRTVTANCRVE